MIMNNLSQTEALKVMPCVNTIVVSYSYLPKQLSEDKMKCLIATLPKEEQFRIHRMISSKAKLEKLFSRLLLEKSYREIYKRENLKYGYTKDGKPFIKSDPSIGISISHSNDLVLCAFAEDAEIGIDIEYQLDREISVFKKYFKPDEWIHIFSDSSCKMEAFYTLWVKKEAVIKADGRGLKIPLPSFSCLQNKVNIGLNEWHFLPLDHFKGYAGQIACNKKATIHLLDYTGQWD